MYIPINVIIAREASIIVLTIAALAIYWWCHRNSDSDDINDDNDPRDDGPVYERLPDVSHIIYSGDECTLTDWRGVVVDRLITFDEFAEVWCKTPAYIGTCHHFNKYGFLYDEGGSMGLVNTYVGFKYREDCIRYRKWLYAQTH